MKNFLYLIRLHAEKLATCSGKSNFAKAMFIFAFLMAPFSAWTQNLVTGEGPGTPSNPVRINLAATNTTGNTAGDFVRVVNTTNDRSVEILQPGYYEISGNSVTGANARRVIVNATESTVTNPVFVTLNGANINSSTHCAFAIEAETHVVMTLQGANHLQSGTRITVTGSGLGIPFLSPWQNYQYGSFAGLFVSPGNNQGTTANPSWTTTNPSMASLTILGPGSLTAIGGNANGGYNTGTGGNDTGSGGGAGIGGHGHGKTNDNGSGGGGTETPHSFGGHSGTITIRGGTIVAQGGRNNNMLNGGTGAGIGGGGGWRTDGGNTLGRIEIHCGDSGETHVTATGGVNNNGGAQTAYGGGGGAGIGGGGAGINGKRGGSNLGGIFIYCGTVVAKGGDACPTTTIDGGNGNPQGAGGAGIGGGGAHSGNLGGSGGFASGLIHFVFTQTDITANGGCGTRGDGPAVGDGGQQGEPIITFITPPHLANGLNLYRPMVAGNDISMNAAVWSHPSGVTTYQWYRSFTEGTAGEAIGTPQHVDGLETFTANYVFPENDPWLISLSDDVERIFYWVEVKTFDLSNLNVHTNIGTSPIITVNLETIPAPQLQFFRNGAPFLNETMFTPVAVNEQNPVYQQEEITITVRNVGNVPYLQIYELGIQVSYDEGVLFDDPVSYTFPKEYLAVNQEFEFTLKNKADLPMKGTKEAPEAYEQIFTVAKDRNVNYGIVEQQIDVTVRFLIVEELFNRLVFTEGFTPRTTYFQGEPLDLQDYRVDLRVINEADGTIIWAQNNIPYSNFGAFALTVEPYEVFIDGMTNPVATPLMHGQQLKVVFTGENLRLELATEPFVITNTHEIIVIGGSVTSPAPSGASNRYLPDDEIKISANPPPGTHFLRWDITRGGDFPAGFDRNSPNPEFTLLSTHPNFTFEAIFAYQITHTAQNGSITGVVMDNNTITDNPFSAVGGSTVTFTAEHDPGLHRLEWWIVGTVKMADQTEAPFTYTHTVNANATINASFIRQYIVDFEVEGEGGAISAGTATGLPPPNDYSLFTSSGVRVDAEVDVTFFAIPATGFRVHEWKVDGTVVKTSTTLGEDTYVLSSLSDDVEVTVSFTDLPLYNVKFSVRNNAGGAISANVPFDTDPENPNGFIARVYEGSSVIFTATTTSGYRIKDWYIDNVVVANGRDLATLPLPNVTANHTVEVEFLSNDFAIVTFMDGSTVHHEAVVEKGERVAMPANPANTDPDAVLIGWYDDITGGARWNFGAPVQNDLTLYAHWDDKQAGHIAVTFMAHGGIWDVQFPSTPNGLLLPPDVNPLPILPNTVFTGWFTDEVIGYDENSDPIYKRWDFSKAVGDVSDFTLYAGWRTHSSNEVPVTFMAHGAIWDVKFVRIDVPTPVSMPDPLPTRDGDALIGWFEDGATTPWIFSTPITAAITLYAEWTPIYPGYHSVTYIVDGGIWTVQLIYSGSTIGTHVVPEVPFKEENYINIGWYKDDGPIAWDFDNDEVTENITLVSRWNPKEITVIFDSNGGSAVTTPVTVNRGEPVEMPYPLPTLAGHTLESWDLDGIPWIFSNPVAPATGVDEITLVAQWTPIPTDHVAVTFIALEGDPTIQVQVVPIGSTVSIPEVASTRPNFVLNGWLTEDDEPWVFSTPVNDNITLYADWIFRNPATHVAVTFLAEDGNPSIFVDVIPIDTPVSVPEGDDAAKRDNHALNGWYTEKPVTNKWDFTQNVTEDKELYAGWTPIPAGQVAVTFIANGGIWDVVVFPENQPFPITEMPADPVRGTDVFTGWFTTLDGTTRWDFSQNVPTNMTLYAQWIEIDDLDVTDRVVIFMAHDAIWDVQIAKATDYLITMPVPAPTLENRELRGWFENGASTPWIFSLPVPDTATPDDPMKLFAEWTDVITAQQFTVTFKVDGGLWDVIAVNSGSVVSRPADPDKGANFVFTGWYERLDDFNTLWEFTTPVTGNIELHAYFVEFNPVNQRIVVFHGNGGEPKTLVRVVNVGSTVSAPATPPTRAEHLFIGWFTETTSVNLWNFATTVQQGSEPLDLYAGWAETTSGFYSVTFIYEDGKTPAEVVQVTADDQTPVTRPEDPTKTDYTFTGWRTAAGTLWDFNAPVTGHMTLTASWFESSSDEHVIVTFLPNNNDLTQPFMVEVEIGKPVERPGDPFLPGHAFIGWFTSEGNIWHFSTPVTENLTLIANYTLIGIREYMVTFVPDNGIDPPFSIGVENDGFTTVERPNDPVKPYYTFVGWYNYNNEQQLWDFNDPVTNHMTLVARYSESQYNVTFDIVDEDDYSIAGATVVFDGKELPGYIATGIAPGTYSYTVTKEGFLPKSGTVDVTNSNIVEKVVLEVDPAYTGVYYKVTFAVVDEGGAPIEGATIVFNNETLTTYYTVNGVFPGTYFYSVSKMGYITEAGSVTVVAADVIEPVTLKVATGAEETYNVVFNIVEKTDNTITVVGASIIFNGSVLTGYIATGIYEGEYLYSVYKEGYKSVSSSVVVDDNMVVTVELEKDGTPIYDEYTVTFIVVDKESQAAIADATIVFNGITLAGYTVSGVKLGEYVYNVSKEGYRLASDRVYVNGNLAITVELEEIKPNEIVETYTVTFNVYEEVNGSNVTVVGATVIFNGSVVTTGYTVSDLEDGEYHYIVSKAGYYSAIGNVIVREDMTVDVLLRRDETVEVESFTVIFNVTDSNGDPLDGATVEFNGITLIGYTAVGVIPGAYTYSVFKEDFVTVDGSVPVNRNVSDADLVVVVDVTLYPDEAADVYITIGSTRIDHDGSDFDYDIPFENCGENTLMIKITSNSTVINIKGDGIDRNVSSNEEITLASLKDGNNIYTITINGNVTYTLTVNVPMVWDKMVQDRWGYRYTVIENPAVHDLVFSSYKWINESSGATVSTDRSYDTGSTVGGSIPTGFRVEAMSQRGLIRSCRTGEEGKSASVELIAYPNPVSSGLPFFVDVEMDEEMFNGVMLEVYDNLGRLVHTQPVRARITEIDGRYASGAYIIILRGNNNFRKEVKLIID